MRQPAAKPPDRPLREREQPFQHAGCVHDVGNEDEQGHGQQQIVVIQAVHGLIDYQADILMAGDHIAEAGGQHRKPHRHAQYRAQQEHAAQNPQCHGYSARSQPGPSKRINRASRRTSTAAMNTTKHA